MYKIYLDDILVGMTKFEKGDPPMGVISGKIEFEKGVNSYELIRDYCIINKVELSSNDAELELLITRKIRGLKIINENDVEVKGIGNQISGMKDEGYELTIEGISYPFYEEEFGRLVRIYEDRFK